MLAKLNRLHSNASFLYEIHGERGERPTEGMVVAVGVEVGPVLQV